MIGEIHGPASVVAGSSREGVSEQNREKTNVRWEPQAQRQVESDMTKRGERKENPISMMLVHISLRPPSARRSALGIGPDDDILYPPSSSSSSSSASSSKYTRVATFE